jgi:hypothetical protein
MIRFWSKVDIKSADECWEWLSSKTSFGHGRFISENDITAHRFSWILFNGAIPDGLCVCHTCDNPGCVNPNHLWVGTKTDNNRDMTAKGRHWQKSKTHCKHGHKFTEENTYNRPDGGRECRSCSRKHKSNYKAKICMNF